MPWIIANATEVTVLDPPPSFALRSLWREPVLSERPTYCGYLLEGFRPDLETGRFLPQRLALARRAGWEIVAPSVRTEDQELAALLGPFLAPTAPRPHAGAPLGLSLFSLDWLESRRGDALARADESLGWAARLVSWIGPESPVFCDPMLELRTCGRTSAESAACLHRPQPGWRRAATALVTMLSEGKRR